MKTIYLIRHGKAGGDGRCSSSTDKPLDDLGILQAEHLNRWFLETSVSGIFSSPYRRCVQTAEIMTNGHLEIEICDELAEMSVGSWENLTFDEIRTLYPQEYELRGKHPGTIPPPGGESFMQAGERLSTCIARLLTQVGGDIAIMSHGGINRGYLCKLTGLDPDKILSIAQPWGGISKISVSDYGVFSVEYMGVKPNLYPSRTEQELLLKKFKVPSGIRAHCAAVAAQALCLANEANIHVDKGLLEAACILHDIAKSSGANHAEGGAEILMMSGYPKVAEIIAAHHNLPKDAGVESELLYLADKQIYGVSHVSLQERFLNSREKCLDPESLAIWRQRYDKAIEISEKYQINIKD